MKAITQFQCHQILITKIIIKILLLKNNLKILTMYIHLKEIATRIKT